MWSDLQKRVTIPQSRIFGIKHYKTMVKNVLFQENLLEFLMAMSIRCLFYIKGQLEC